MSLNWIDVSQLSFNTLLLLERVQLSWFPGWVKEEPLAIALQANPAVEWYLRHKCPQLNPWLDGIKEKAAGQSADAALVRRAEMAVLDMINDLVVYVVDATIYDNLPFLGWDSNELTSLVDFSGKTVIDIGSGTGRLAFTAAEKAAAVFAVEPVGNLRYYLKEKARKLGFRNVYVVDGLITDLPFPDGFADVTMEAHVFGDAYEAEHQEMRRVTRAGGMVIHCPGNNDRDDEVHHFLAAQGYQWSRFEEPTDGMKRKYWKMV